MANNIRQTIEYQISKVEIIGFSLNPVDFEFDPKRNFSFLTNVNVGYDPKIKEIVAITDVDISREIMPDVVIGSISTLCTFRVLNHEELVPNDAGDIVIASKNAETFRLIAISTTRGLIHGVFRGSPLHHAVLPVITPEIIKKLEEQAK